MKDWLDAAAAVEKLGIIGILTGAVMILIGVVKVLWAKVQELQKKLLKAVQGKDIND